MFSGVKEHGRGNRLSGNFLPSEYEGQSFFFKPVYIVIFVVAAMKYPGQQLKEGSNYFGLKFQDIFHYGGEVLTKASGYIVSPIRTPTGVMNAPA